MKKKTKNKIMIATLLSCMGIMLGLTANKFYSEVKESKADSLHYENVKKVQYNDEDYYVDIDYQYIINNTFNNYNRYLYNSYENEVDFWNSYKNGTELIFVNENTDSELTLVPDDYTLEETNFGYLAEWDDGENVITLFFNYNWVDNKFRITDENNILNNDYVLRIIDTTVNHTIYPNLKESFTKDLINVNDLAIKFTKDQFNENTYKTLNKTLYDNYNSMSMSTSKFYAVTNSLTYQFNCDETYTDEVQYFKVSYEAIVNTHSYEIEFNYQIGNDNKFHLVKDNVETTEIESEQVLNYYLLLTTENDYELVANAVAVDNQANMGSSIIGAVTTGLGLIGDLASEFLTGFSTLFWDATNNQLTSFGLFSMVFLGLAITMAVIKLVLAILRSNTGV